MYKTVFIAIPFNSDFTRIYETAILPAFSDLGLRCIKIDEGKLHEEINKEIEEALNDAAIVFGDLSTLNANVFYEIGFARALDKDIITATQFPETVPFDLKSRRFIKYSTSDTGLELFKASLKAAASEILKKKKLLKINPKAYVHGTKFDVPNRNEFWNKLCTSAQNKFYLLGRSNKSWIDKDQTQQQELAESIIRIITNKGQVRIISDRKPETIQKHKDFYKKFIKPLLQKPLMSAFKKNFVYCATEHTNYEAVISDSRIVILPTMNTDAFVHESLVLELEGSNSPQLSNYLADIERLCNNKEECEIIDITSNGTKK